VASLIQRAADIDWASVAKTHTIGWSAGGSVPECLIDEVVAPFRDRYEMHLKEVTPRHQGVRFNVSRALAP